MRQRGAASLRLGLARPVRRNFLTFEDLSK
jgi:hypothetical protein